MTRSLYLEHDGKVLLVDLNGDGPREAVMGRIGEVSLRLPTEDEVRSMGIGWTERRTNRIKFGEKFHEVVYALPEIEWPEYWTWKDNLISDGCVDPLARECVYRSMHRVVSKVMVVNSENHVLMAKVSRGFFTGYWTLPGGFVDYGEHPREAAVREAMEELGIDIAIDDPKGETGDAFGENDGAIIREEIFNEDGVNWVSFTYRCNGEFGSDELTPKNDEIEEARWFSKSEALEVAVSIFDIEAIQKSL
jgi:8-oxo-dGTP pyrophosphatase MutT (NUDIX family)